MVDRLSRQLSLELVCPGPSPFAVARGLKVRRSPPFPSDTVRSALFGPVVASYCIQRLRSMLADYDVVVTNWPANLVAPFAHPKVLFYCYEPYQRLYDDGFVSTLPRRQKLFVGMIKPFYLPYDKTASKRIHTFMTIDGWTASEIHRIYRRYAVVVGSGIDATFFKRTSSASLSETYRGKKVILCFAKDLGRYTGADHLIAALGRVVKVIPEALLVVIIRSPNRERQLELEELASRLGIRKNMELLPFVPEDELPAYYSIAEVVVIPFFFQNTTLIAKEAMACETPVVTWNSRAAEDIGDSNTGILVREGSVQGMADAITRILSDPGLAEEMGREGRRRVLERFTLEKTASNMLRAVKEAQGIDGEREVHPG